MAIKDALTPEARERAQKLAGADEQKHIHETQELPPFPPDDLPSPYRDLLQLIAPTTEAPLEGLLLAIFCALAAALGRKVAFPCSPLLYPMIWGLVLAPPYFYRKGSVLYWAVEIARQLTPGLKILNGLGSIERINDMLSEQTNIKLLLRVAEIGGTITKGQRSGTSNLIPDICDLYDHIDGWETGTKQSKPCSGYEVTLLSLSTLRSIKPLIKESYIAGGFLRRIAIVQATKRPALPHQPPLDRTKFDRIIAEIRGGLTRYNDETRHIDLNDQAKEYYANWYIPWREKSLKLPQEQMEVAGGTESMIRKLALQRAAIEDKPHITQEIIAWAIRWGEFFQTHTLTVVSHLALFGSREVEQRILTLLESEPLRTWEIQQRLNDPPPAIKLRHILDGMAGMNMLDHWNIARPKKGSGEWFGLRGSKPEG